MLKIKFRIAIFYALVGVVPLSDFKAYSQDLGKNAKDTTLIISLYDSANTLLYSNPETSRSLLHEALKMSEKINFRSGIALGYNYLGILSSQRGLLDSATHYFEKSLEQVEKLNNQKKLSSLLGNLSIVYADQNRLADAIRLNRKSIQLKLKFQDTIAIANGYNNLSSLYYDIGNIDEAIYLQHKSIELRKAINDTVGLASNYGNLASYYNTTGKLDSAYYLIHKSIALHKRFNHKLAVAQSYGILSESHYLKGSLDSAKTYVNNSLNLSEELDLSDLTEEMTILRSKILLKQNELDNALSKLKNKKQYSNTRYQISALQMLAQIYYKKKDFHKSAYYFEKYTYKNDSIQKIHRSNQLAELTTNYAYELRELELENKQNLREAELKQIIKEEKQETFRLLLIIIFTILLLAVSIGFLLAINQKNKALNIQRKKIQELIALQEETIENRTSELLSTKNIISRYAFLNSHELRGPLARILSLIYLSEKQDIDQAKFISTLKESANELEEAVRKIGNELDKTP